MALCCTIYSHVGNLTKCTGAVVYEYMNDILESTFGKVCIIIYTLFAILSYVLSVACGAEACALAMVWPILPWAFILATDFGFSFTWVMYPVFVLLNASVSYVFGAGVEWLYHWYREVRTEQFEKR